MQYFTNAVNIYITLYMSLRWRHENLSLEYL